VLRLPKKTSALLFAIVLVSWPMSSAGYGYPNEDNPFVEAMLRMMEVFGFIDRDRLPLGVPFLPATGYGSPWNPGLGGLTGTYPMTGLPGLGGGPMSGLGTVPGVAGMTSGYPLAGAMGGLPGLGGNPMSGFGGVPGAGGQPRFSDAPWGSTNPWQSGMPFASGGPPGQHSRWTDGPAPKIGLLDGIWETNKGGVVIIKADAARLYVSRDRYQDFIIRYDHNHFWWQPRDGSKFRRYRYEMREGRMILADDKNNLLLLRRRR